MKQLSKTVNLTGESMIEIVLCTPPKGETTEQQYNRIRDKVVSVIGPLTKTYLEGLRLEAKLKEIDTVEKLEAEPIVYLSLDIKNTLADTIDEFKELSDWQRVYVLTLFLSAYLDNAAKFCNAIFLRRAQEIATSKSNRIITMN